MIQPSIPIVFVVCILTLLLSCDDGGGDTDRNIDDYSSNEVNGNLSGYILLGSNHEGFMSILDLNSGKYSFVAATNESLLELDAYPSMDGKTLAFAEDDCIREGLRSKSCIYITDENGQMLQQIERFGDFYEAKPSPDGQVIAVRWKYGYTPDVVERLALFSRQGEFLEQTSKDVAWLGYAWLPDGRLVISSEQTIYLSDERHSVVGKAIKEFMPEQGRPIFLNASPDGEKVAFTLVTDSNPARRTGHVFVMNVDGTGLRQLTDVNNPGDENAMHPLWSPDGKWILVINDKVGLGDIYHGVGLPGGLIAVQSDATKVNLDGILDLDPDVARVIKVLPDQGTYSTIPLAWLPAPM